MKQIFLSACLLFMACIQTYAQKELVLCSTGNGFDRTASNGVNSEKWSYFQKFTNLTYNGQDASVTAIRLHIEWNQYEPTVGNYYGAKLAQAVAAILALKPGMKVALHFPYFRPGPQPGQTSEGFLADDEIARFDDGAEAEEQITHTLPSVYSSSAKTKFYNFVNDALNHLAPYYSNILYVAMGNAAAEEFHIPTTKRNGFEQPAFYEDAAKAAWRTQYLPCRYPGQDSVTWGGIKYKISSAPTYFPGQYGDWTSDIGKEYHRFAGWGLMNLYKGFRDIVKGKSASLKVLYFISHFGSHPGNLATLHNSTIPMALQEFDGIYTSDGSNTGDLWRKILPLDVIKGTAPNKIAANEFDPTDLGEDPGPPKVAVIFPNIATEWMSRSYKHGADYVHLAMHFEDGEINQLAEPLATIRANYVNGSYTSPARQNAISENIVPNVFTGNAIFQPTWNSQSGSDWPTTDLSPKSVATTDAGYWENIWSCSAPDPCNFNMTASTQTPNPAGGSNVTLNSSCSGSACTGLSYAWSGNGISGTGSSVTFPAPTTAGTYTYTVTVSKSGCSNKTANVSITVPPTGCDFSVTASVSPTSVVTGGAANLSYSACTGANCSGVTYAWSGNGVSGSSSPLPITAPGTAGTYTYTVTASKSGCANKTSNAVLTVTPSGGGSYDQCKESELSTGNGAVTSDPNASNGETRGEQSNYNHYVEYSFASVPSAGTYTAKLRYYSSAAPTVSVVVNGGTPQTINLTNSGSWNIVSTEHTFSVNLQAGTNTIRISGTGGGSCRQDKLCVTGSGGGCTPPAAPSLDASPDTITTTGGSSTLTATGCNGGVITWSDGLGTGTSKSVSPTTTTTYYATCSLNGCTSANASITVTVNIPSGNYNQCKESELSTGDGTVTGDPNASNGETRGLENNNNHYVEYSLTGVPSAGTYYLKLRYYSSSAPTVGVKVNSGSTQTWNLPNSGSWNIVSTEQTIAVNLAAGANTIRISGISGGSCRQDRICVSNSSSSRLAAPVVKPQASSGIDIQEGPAATPITLYPNPSNGSFEVRFYLARGKKAALVITDVLGRVIQSRTIAGNGQHRETIQLNGRPSGTLFLQLRKEDGVEIRKLLLVK